jgi:putative oxidoreductase
MKEVLLLRFLAPLAPLGWAIVRLVAGGMLALHGWHKVNGGIPGFAESLDKMNVPAPEIAAWASALVELVGGAFVALGILVRPAAAAIAVNMAVAILLAHRDDLTKIGTPEGGAVEYPILLFAVAFGAMLAGSGFRRATPPPAQRP